MWKPTVYTEWFLVYSRHLNPVSVVIPQILPHTALSNYESSCVYTHTHIYIHTYSEHFLYTEPTATSLFCLIVFKLNFLFYVYE